MYSALTETLLTSSAGPDQFRALGKILTGAPLDRSKFYNQFPTLIQKLHVCIQDFCSIKSKFYTK